MLVEIRDIEAALRRDLTQAENDVLPQLVELVEADAALITGRPIVHTVIVDEEHLVALEDTTIVLRNTPVWSVESLRVFPLQNDTGPGTVIDPRNYIRRYWGIEFLWTSALVSILVPVPIKISYTAGLDDSVPGYATIRSVIAARIKRILAVSGQQGALAADPSIVEQIAVEGYNVKYRADGGQPWTATELTILQKFARPQIA